VILLFYIGGEEVGAVEFLQISIKWAKSKNIWKPALLWGVEILVLE